VPVFLPVAELSINAFWLIGAGGVVGFLSGLLGVGGGFLLTPILMMIGIPATVAAASDTNAIIATSSSGVAAHFRLGNVDVKMGSIMLLGGLTGAAIGVEIIKILRALGNADVLIKLTYVALLGAVGGFMMLDSLRNMRGGRMAAKARRPKRQHSILQRLPFQMRFPRSHVQHSVIVPYLLGTVVGVLAAVMGVGGGFLMVPLMVYLLGMSPHLAVGTSLFQILFTCAGVTYMQATTNHTADLVLALLLAVGSTVGAQMGAVVSKLLRGEQLMIILACMALAVVVKMGFSLTVTPSSLLAPAAHEQTGETAAAERPHRPPDIAPASGNGTVTVTPPVIQIDAAYSGQDVRIQGVASPGSKVVVVARGPETEEVFDRKGRAGPIWITRNKVHISGVPTLFMRYSSEPAENFLSADEITRYQLDPAAIENQMRIAPDDPEDQKLRRDFVSVKKRENIYRIIDGGLQMGTPGPAGTPFTARFHWPRRAPSAVYDIQVHECRGGAVASTTTVPLRVMQVGFPAFMADMAQNRAPLYGIMAIVATMLGGFGIDFLASLLRKRKRYAVPADAGAAGGPSH